LLNPDKYLIWVPLTITARPEVCYLTGTTPPRTIRFRPIKARIENGVLRLIGGSAQVNEEQQVTVTGNPFTLTYSGQTTANISSTSTFTQVEAALVALSNLESGDVPVVGTAPNFTVFFQGNLAGTNVSQMSAPNATVSTVDQGADNAGVRLTAKTSVLGLGDVPLLYDVTYGKGTINGVAVNVRFTRHHRRHGGFPLDKAIVAHPGNRDGVPTDGDVVTDHEAACCPHVGLECRREIFGGWGCS
jgi:hypothetical protein